MSLLFTHADIVATNGGQFEYLRNAYLGVEGDTIDYIGVSAPLKQYSNSKNMSNHMLIPGLINCHGHSAMNLLKGMGSDLPLQEWLQIMWATEDRMRDEDFVNGMNMAILEMLASGTTSFCDMYMRPSITQKCIDESGMKANLTRVMMGGDKNTDYRTYQNRLEALDFVKTYDGAFGDRLHADWSVHAEYTIDPDIAQKWAEETTELGGRLHIHISETQQEHEACIGRYGMTPVRWLEERGFFKIPTYAAHCVWCTEDDLHVLQSHGVSVVHNPESNLKLGSGFAPIPRMLELGMNVALGTDGAASNNNLNMFEEMHVASIVHNGYTNDPVIMTPETILTMATANGARVQGRNDTGSLEVGKKADIVAVNLDAPHMRPNLNPLALLTYSAQGSDVTLTMVDGNILYENGEYITMDKEKISYEFEASVRYLYG
jgi:5-methylthioadenosine/S-adenosylhomocysteine deaminase